MRTSRFALRIFFGFHLAKNYTFPPQLPQLPQPFNTTTHTMAKRSARSKQSKTFATKVSKASKSKATKIKNGLLAENIDAILVNEGLLPGKAQNDKLSKAMSNVKATDDKSKAVDDLMDQLGGL
ncbi:Protein of unknown function [Pyronema omphalodes CBS 100304]|uniref:Uncharacterized protein n=1 Tax=Pyronema omphalodes (strain CBS 100304) TaxID=1076935 RepID=U4LE99_PYROM|nr:Protein of unknown function [Pyronema omphalodes CBS 100304]